MTKSSAIFGTNLVILCTEGSVIRRLYQNLFPADSFQLKLLAGNGFWYNLRNLVISKQYTYIDIIKVTKAWLIYCNKISVGSTNYMIRILKVWLVMYCARCLVWHLWISKFIAYHTWNFIACECVSNHVNWNQANLAVIVSSCLWTIHIFIAQVGYQYNQQNKLNFINLMYNICFVVQPLTFYSE